MSYDVKADWTTAAGLRAVVVMNDMGFHCGYVGVPKGHPYYGRNYNYMPDSIEVHGGLTYCTDDEGCTYPVPSDGLWWFGYDCAHLYDGRDPAWVNPAAEYGFRDFHTGTFRDLDYCKAQCESLARQFANPVTEEQKP